MPGESRVVSLVGIYGGGKQKYAHLVRKRRKKIFLLAPQANSTNASLIFGDTYYWTYSTELPGAGWKLPLPRSPLTSSVFMAYCKVE